MNFKIIYNTNMKTRILLFGLLICSVKVNAQQRPHYTQYIINQYALNPALSGIENYTDIKISHRRQWVGLDGAPVTTYFTAHTPIGKQDYKTSATSFDINGENPLGERYWEDYTASPAHHGAGIQIFNDKIGPFNDFSAYGTYAYHIPIGLKTNLSAGIGLGFGNLSLSTDKLFFGNQNPVDPAVAGSGQLSKLRFNARAGLWLYSSDYFAGISVLDIIPQKIDFANNTARVADGKWKPHIFLTGGFRGMINDDINFVPSLMVKYINPIPVQVEANIKLLYKNFLWAGASYRHNYGFAALAGVNLNNTLQVSYSYDYSITKLNQVSNGSHEVILGFIIGNNYSQQTCPKNVY
jgi:type IX secretion system PorP/SprF family membrane protein